jgi:hypothetical protein
MDLMKYLVLQLWLGIYNYYYVEVEEVVVVETPALSALVEELVVLWSF